MLRTAFWYSIGWVYLILASPYFLWFRYLEKRNRSKEMDELANRVSRRLSRFLFKLTGSSIEVTGTENIPPNQAVLFVSNHQCHMDSAIVHGFIDVDKGFVSIVEVLKIPVLRTWMKYMKCVFLDRNDIRQTLTCIDKSAELLKQGHSMVIYPEGKLSLSNTVNEFKKGSLKLAFKAGVPIVPVTLVNSYKVMTRNGDRVSAVKVELKISEPIYPEGAGKEEEKKITEMVRDIIVSRI